MKNLNNHFYTLLGAITSAYNELCVADGGTPLGDKPAHGDPHLDPKPGKAGDAKERLKQVQQMLLDAETELNEDLDNAQDAEQKRQAWDAFWPKIADASYIFAAALRRLLWMQTGPRPEDGVGGFGWHRLRADYIYILKLWAEVGCGGGGGHGVADPSGIFGSSGEYISFP